MAGGQWAADSSDGAEGSEWLADHPSLNPLNALIRSIAYRGNPSWFSNEITAVP